MKTRRTIMIKISSHICFVPFIRHSSAFCKNFQTLVNFIQNRRTPTHINYQKLILVASLFYVIGHIFFKCTNATKKKSIKYYLRQVLFFPTLISYHKHPFNMTRTKIYMKNNIHYHTVHIIKGNMLMQRALPYFFF